MRNCGGCTLCCKLEGIRELDKRTGEWCQHCIMYHGCRIYPDRPNVCRDFRCLWLDDESMPEAMRPDRAGAYIARAQDCVRVCVDDGCEGAEIIRYARAKGHVIVHRKHQVNFICGDNMPMPEKLLLDWTL